MEKMKMMKDTLMAQACAQMGNLECVDAKELGEVIDMIKDLEEAIYYCTIVEAMNKKDENENVYYYREKYPREEYMDMNPRYYNGGGPSMGGGPRDGNSYYTEREMPVRFRDEREGRSPMTRRMYMESKELHHDQAKRMKELEDYMKELGEDIMEMIEDATPEEKAILQKKISTLATKINV